MQKVKFDTIVSAYSIKYYMQKKKKYTRKRLQKEHVNGWKMHWCGSTSASPSTVCVEGVGGEM